MERTNQDAQPLSKLLPQGIPDFSNVELTAEETEAALNYARMIKFQKLEEHKKKQKQIEKVKTLMTPWTTDELRLHIRARAKSLPFYFELDEENQDVFDLLCLYFSANPEFEKHGFKDKHGNTVQSYSLKKGICLHSKERGTGKTVFMELFSINRRACYAVIPTAKISRFFEADGDKIISRFSVPWACERVPQYFYQSPIGVCFDDFGDEEVKNHYGNRENVMNRILTAIYGDHPDHAVFPFFHMTTNLTGDEIEQKYDKRVRSRMREMFNWIELPGKDRRK
jgi:hypothetical protein